MSLILNRSVAVEVAAPGGGVRLDVQRECVVVHPALGAYEVHPAPPLHDCGPNGVRLYAPTLGDLQAAAPSCGSPWDVWLEADA